MASKLHTGDESCAENESLRRAVAVLEIEEPSEADDIEIDPVVGPSATLSKALMNQDDTTESDEAEGYLLNHTWAHSQIWLSGGQ
jgi:hypothetical protein